VISAAPRGAISERPERPRGERAPSAAQGFPGAASPNNRRVNIPTQKMPWSYPLLVWLRAASRALRARSSHMKGARLCWEKAADDLTGAGSAASVMPRRGCFTREGARLGLASTKNREMPQ